MKKEQAIQLRKKGLTYNQISLKLDVAKSTLSSWFRTLDFNEKIKKENYSKAQEQWSENITKYNIKRAIAIKEKNLINQTKESTTIKPISKQQLKLLGTALYWAEGYKRTRWNIIFCNSDPQMINLMMKFFRTICDISLDKIKGQVQIHPNIEELKAQRYWSKISRIPIGQFRKSLKSITRSSKQKRKYNTLPYGTFRIIINDVQLVNKIKGWIDGISKQF